MQNPCLRSSQPLSSSTQMSSRHLTFFVLLFLSVFAQLVRCQNVNDYSDFDNPAVRPLITQLVYSRISNLTTSFSSDIRSHSSFCIKDSDADWNRTFNFSNNLDFVSSCIQKTRGDITRRLCTAAETRLYFKGLFGGEKHGNHLRPNRNCNLSSWLSGCEPGWSCSSGSDQKVDLRESNVIPSRTLDCQPCCEGFFCPHGLTCMIPCPLGSYCPLATLNKTAGVCEPYLYQLPQGRPNHSCGGANTWADVGTGSELFCSSGSYCPTTVERLNCTSGHYCRLGSTSERRCFQLASCGSNTKNQDIEAYGILLITGLGTLLLIIYNCSDQVLSTKERRVAKSRAAAAKSARQTAKARQRWKSAKTNVMKGASGLQAQLSKTFSRKRDTMSFEKLSKGEVSPSGPSDEMETMPRIEDHAGNAHSSNADSDPGNMTKGKKISTQSQIFKYAYNQLEREKAQQQELKDMSFSGVIKMATGNQIKNRPLIEISFRDLTLTLKTKKKALLRCVTGDIKPGRVTSVMGPSGAGKTTLLSAIAGKATGCKITGSILINGKRESVHSYKKIIGFVPQDDIVHGNLTVEENLWFSAISRLPVDLVKADRFLVVERVIESLGLEGVRNSLVGTVEKRGISGGQRKRVNVGLEMVMEPSLLLLDEPTSGLDSASSQQLLRAVRREALEGVNVCMVVHQPSYALFNMFDDLILLAKGGLTVYHGPVKHVEDYFADLGIVVPERVNPPDYFIDILEGIVSPKKDASLDYKELPLRWMVYKGYRVPGDMKPDLENIASSSTALESSHQTDVIETHGNDEHSFAGDLWRDVKSNVELHREKIRLNFSSSEDLAKRKTPGVFQQYRYFLGRVGKQRLREAKIQAVDYLILLLAGACLGSLSRDGDRNFGSAGYTYTIIGVSLLCKISALRSFSLDKLHYWRESSSGMSSLAYFLAKDTIDHFNTVVKPVVYLSTYYFLTNPRSSFADNYVVLLCLVYCVTGIAYALAISFEQGGAQLWSVLLPVVLTLVATRTNGNEIVKSLANLCYPRWALEAFVISNAERYSGVWLITRCGSLLSSGYSLHDWSLCVSILILIGVIGRVVAFFCMIVFQKK